MAECPLTSVFSFLARSNVSRYYWELNESWDSVFFDSKEAYHIKIKRKITLGCLMLLTNDHIQGGFKWVQNPNTR